MSQFDCFLTPEAISINKARQQHLASMGLRIGPGSVLEVGAGIGLHTQFFLDRSCQVTITDGRKENVIEIQRRWPDLPSRVLDLDSEENLAHLGQFDMIYCYGLLYHLKDPEGAIKRMAEICQGQIFLELICSTDTDTSMRFCQDPNGYNQSVNGQGCRPSRSWILERLKKYFGHGYISITQPNHPEFPTNWDNPSPGNTRAVFVGSKQQLDNGLLTDRPLQMQEVCYNMS